MSCRLFGHKYQIVESHSAYDACRVFCVKCGESKYSVAKPTDDMLKHRVLNAFKDPLSPMPSTPSKGTTFTAGP